MVSKNHVKSISISQQAHDRVLFEGDLGELVELAIIDYRALELVGKNGVLLIEIEEDLLRRVLQSPNHELNLSAEEGRSKDTQTAKTGT